MILEFRVFLKLILNVCHFFLGDISSANWTPLVLRQLVLNLHPELVFLLEPLHIPVPVDTEQVESVEASINSY